MSQPLQPIYKDEHGVVRFKANTIVRFLLDAGPFDMNQLALMPFSVEDREQFAQLIGYSVSGFGELPYVTDATYDRIPKEVEEEKPQAVGTIGNGVVMRIHREENKTP